MPSHTHHLSRLPRAAQPMRYLCRAAPDPSANLGSADELDALFDHHVSQIPGSDTVYHGNRLPY